MVKRVVAAVTIESVEATPPLYMWFHTSASIPMPWPSLQVCVIYTVIGTEKQVWEERLPVSLYTTTNEAHLLYNYHPHIWYDSLEGFRSTSELREREVQVIKNCRGE